MTYTKADLTDLPSDGVRFNQTQAKELIEVFFAEISANLVAGEEVKLSGFGNFSLRDKVARPGRNPATGEFAEITARRVVAFHPSNKLKEIVASAPLIRTSDRK